MEIRRVGNLKIAIGADGVKRYLSPAACTGFMNPSNTVPALKAQNILINWTNQFG